MTHSWQSRLILGLSLGVLFILCVLPFIKLGGMVVFPNGAFTLEYFIGLFEGKSTLLAIKNTIWVSVAAAFLSTVIALPLSWLLTRTNLPYASFWRSIFCLPYAIPPYIGAIAWITLGNPSNGLLNTVFGKGFINIYTQGGLIWVMATFFYTFVLLSLLSALDRMDPSLEEAARLCGAGPVRLFFQITVPIILPSLLSGILLVMLAAAASFGVPAMIGNPAGIYLMTTRIYTYQKMGSLSGIYSSGALSMILLVLALAVLIINQKLLHRGHHQTVSGKSSRVSSIDLGQWRWPAFAVLLVLFTLLFIMPLSGILLSALSKVQGVLSFSNLGFQNFTKIFFEVNETPRAFANSFKLAFGAATFAMGLGMIMAYLKVKTKMKGRNFIEVFASLPYATPGTVLALAFILFFGKNYFGFSLYNTLFLIGLAYVAKYLNFSLRTCSDGLGQIDDCLAEAARVSGATWGKTMTSIWFPLMKPALAASWFLVFMPAFSELTMTILLTGPGLETLGTLLFQLQEYGDASGGGGSVLALIIIVFVVVVNFAVKYLSRGKYGL